MNLSRLINDEVVESNESICITKKYKLRKEGDRIVINDEIVVSKSDDIVSFRVLKEMFNYGYLVIKWNERGVVVDGVEKMFIVKSKSRAKELVKNLKRKYGKHMKFGIKVIYSEDELKSYIESGAIVLE